MTRGISREPRVEVARIEELTKWCPLEEEVDGQDLIWFRGDSMQDVLEGMPVRGWPQPRRDIGMLIGQLTRRMRMQLMARKAIMNGPMMMDMGSDMGSEMGGGMGGDMGGSMGGGMGPMDENGIEY